MVMMFGKESKHLGIISNAKWKDEEERKKIVAEMIKMSSVPVKSLLDIFINLYQDVDRRKKIEKIFTIEEILSKVKDNKVAPELIRALPKIVDTDAKKASLRVLTQVAEPGIDRLLIPLLRDKDSDIREEVEKILCKIGKRTTFEYLKDQLFTGIWRSRVNALRVCRNLGGQDAIGVYKNALKSGNYDDVRTSIESLAEFNIPAANKVLMEASTHNFADIRARVAGFMGKIGGPEAIKTLLDMTNDDDNKVKIAAMQALEQVGGKEVVRHVILLLKQNNAKVRLQAVKLLAKLGDETVIEPLMGMMKDNDLFVRQEVINTLGAMAREGRVNIGNKIIDLMKDVSVNVRRAAIEIVKLAGDDSTLLVLLDFLKDEDWWVREQVAETLGELGGEKVAAEVAKLLKEKDSEIRYHAVSILNKIKSPSSIPQLVQMLKDPDWLIRETTVEALGNTGEKKVIPLLAKILKVNELRPAAVQAMGKLKDKATMKPLMEILAVEKQADVKQEIYEALAEIGGEEVTDLLKKGLEEPEKQVRLRCHELLEILKVDVKEDAEEGQRRIRKKYFSPLDNFLMETKEKGGSDLFLSADSPPLMKYHGEIVDTGGEAITNDTIEKWLFDIMSEARERQFKISADLDMSYETPAGDRFRVNIYRHRLGMAAVFRVIPDEVPTIKSLGFPESLTKLTTLHQGIVLVTGPASCGKTTTVAAMVDQSNKNRLDHIITIEDPIEYIHESKGCLVDQREVGSHTNSFLTALRASLREDPDIILVGELRDLETISMAITAAETGHLVFGTLHTTSASNTIDRIIDAYPPSQQSQIRTMLSESLRAVISQQLVRTRDGKVTAALEILLHNASLSKMIRDGKTYQIPSVMITGRNAGMQTMDQALQMLVKKGIITGEEAYRKAFDKKEFAHYVSHTSNLESNVVELSDAQN